MDADRPGRPKAHTYTVAALLGLFVVAILLVLPRGLLAELVTLAKSRLAQRRAALSRSG